MLNNSSDLTQSPCRSTAILPIVVTESLKTNVRVCVCVHPWTKGSQPTSAGGLSTEVTVQRRGFCGGTDISSGRGTDVPAFNTLTPLVHPAAVRCFHGPSSCYLPQKQVFPLHFLADRELQPAADCRLAPVETFLNNTVCADSCALPFPHHFPNVVTESLKTNVRVCFAQPSHSGAECDPRHRGAAFA